MKSPLPFRGVSAVPLRAICREANAAHRLADRASWEAAVLELWDGAEYREEVTPTMRCWAVDDDLRLRRTAILCQLDSKSDTDTELLRFALESNLEDSLHGREFFIRKAVGWALR